MKKENPAAFLFVVRSPCTIFAGVKTKGCRARTDTEALETTAEIIPLRPDAVNAAVGIAHPHPALFLMCAGQGASAIPLLRNVSLFISYHHESIAEQQGTADRSPKHRGTG